MYGSKSKGIQLDRQVINGGLYLPAVAIGLPSCLTSFITLSRIRYLHRDVSVLGAQWGSSAGDSPRHPSGVETTPVFKREANLSESNAVVRQLRSYEKSDVALRCDLSPEEAPKAGRRTA
jgi:hypothetical protein